MTDREDVINLAALRTYSAVAQRLADASVTTTDRAWLIEQIAWHTKSIGKLQDRLDELDGKHDE